LLVEATVFVALEFVQGHLGLHSVLGQGAPPNRLGGALESAD
jgi:hypothetical protein